MTETDRILQEFLDSLSGRFAKLDKRLSNLEGYEYTSTHYHGTMAGKQTETQNILIAAANYYRVRGMYSRSLKGFSIVDNALVCEKTGLYMFHYSLGVTLAATIATVTARLYGDTSLETFYVASTGGGVSGDKFWLSKAATMNLVAGDEVYLAITSSTTPTTLAVNNASVTLHRIGDS